ncbi:MAG: tRNA 2-thiocytidine biosynthesis protein TtcA, partial [Spirochaetes bacterium]|nr:tRNA 2-thiocytidine biosynthesis protein TtcA [Spirochaetota bacterium]
KTIFEYKMIEENDKILVGVSGGKDSMTLLYDLVKRQKSFPIKYSIEAVHIKTDISHCLEKRIEELFKEWGVKYHIIKVNVLKRLRADKKMNCFWCSTQRRMELLKIAKKNGFNKIALGHHLDDIIETFLMNIFFKSEIATMLPVFKYKKYPCLVIRPLALVKEEEIAQFAENKNFDNLISSCPYGKNSKRLEIRRMIKDLAKNNKSIRENIFKAMKNVNVKYLLQDTSLNIYKKE